MINARLVVKSGGDVPKKLLEVFKSLTKDKRMFAVPWALVGEHLIKHSASDKDRGMIIATFRNLGVDLSKFASDTSRLPQRNRPVDRNEEGKGRRIRIFAEGNRLKLEVRIANPQRLWTDIMNDKRSPLMPYLAQMFEKANLRGTKR